MNKNIVSDINSLKNKLNQANNKKLYKVSDLNRMLSKYISLKHELKYIEEMKQRILKIEKLKNGTKKTRLVN